MSMIPCDQIVITDICFVNHLIGNAPGSYTVYPTDSAHHCQLLYKLNGKATVTFDKKTICEKTGDVRFLPNPSLFEYEPKYSAYVHEKDECINIGFTTTSPLPMEILVKDYTKHPTLKHLFQKIQKYWYYKHDGYYIKCMSILYEILYEISSKNSMYLPSKTFNTIVPAIEYIDNHFTYENIDCEHLANLCNVSHTYMSKIFIKHYGVSPNKYITSKKINYACDLLKSRCYTIGEISQLCGFTNTYYFSRVFKNYTGVCPSEYIKSPFAK